MPKKLYNVHLTETEREQLEMYVNQGKKSTRSITRARILLLADEEYHDEDIMDTLGISRQTVYKVRKKYNEGHYQHILDLLPEKARPGQPLKVDSRVESHVAMLACSESPPGTARWTLKMIADRLVELQVVDAICLESVRKALKKTNSNLGSISGGV
jgi:transposase